MGIKDRLKSMVFEDTATPTDEVKVRTGPKVVAEAAPPMTMEDAHNLYEKLFEKTNFAKTNAGQTIQKYADTLASVPDPALRLKLAISQAKAIDKLSDQDIEDAFSTVTDRMAKERGDFDDAMAAFELSEVTEPSKRLEELIEQEEQIRAEQKKLMEKSENGKVQLAKTKAEFENAVNRRTAEIGQEKAAVLAASKG